MALHSVHVQDTSNNVVNWATQAQDKALEALATADMTAAKALIVEAQGMLDWALNGKDGSNAPVIDGGGARTAYRHSQLMAGYSPVFAIAPPSGLQVAAPPAPPPTGDTTVAVVVKMGLIAALVLVLMGGMLLMRTTRSQIAIKR